MNNFLEKLKDILYDFMDYIIMIAIVLVVVGVIGWRLDILFADDNKNTNKKDIAKQEVTIKDDGEESEDTDISEGTESIKDEDREEIEIKEDKDNKDIATENKSPSDDSKEDEKAEESIVTVNIPKVNSSFDVAEALKDSGLITSRTEFRVKAKSMGLERKLRPGVYDINTNSTMEEMVKMIAGKK